MALMTTSKGRQLVQSNLGSVGTTSWGTAVTTGGTSSTKGTPAELIASTNFDCHWVIIYAAGYAVAATDSRGCMDIMIGAATEQIVIPNLLFGNAGNTFTANDMSWKVWEFPLYIPAGTRISCQAAGSRTSTAFRVGVQILGGKGDPGYRVGTRVDTYGIGTVPAGTSITPGASGAEGSWTQVTASTSADYFGVVPSFQSSATTLNIRTFTLDVGVGTATEEEVQGNFGFATNSLEATCGAYPSFAAPIKIPASSRLVARASCSAGIDSGYEVALHCIR